MHDSQQLPVDAAAFRSAMSNFVTGVTVVTSIGERGPTGTTVNSLTSVSLDPCQVLICLKRASVTGDSIRHCGRFAVSMLRRSQKELALRFARADDERFEGLDYIMDDWGVPIIPGALAQLACTLEALHESGDHDIYVGLVRSCIGDGSDPLVFYRGSFDCFEPASFGSR